MSKPLRQTMPTVTAFIDDLRAAFGREIVDAAIKNGMAGGTDFYARENGVEVGNLPPAREGGITLDQIVLGPLNPPRKDTHG